jgi:hypothetical protein
VLWGKDKRHPGAGELARMVVGRGGIVCRHAMHVLAGAPSRRSLKALVGLKFLGIESCGVVTAAVGSCRAA